MSMLTVSQLKVVCAFLGLGAGGAKAALVKKIVAALN
jgi:hypothetical protein